MRKTSGNLQLLTTLILAIGTAVGGYLSRGITVINNQEASDCRPVAVPAPLSTSAAAVFHPAAAVERPATSWPSGSVIAAVREFEAAAERNSAP